MNKYFFILGSALLFFSCSDSKSDRYVDEEHRPQDWHSTIALTQDSSLNSGVWQTYFLTDVTEAAQYESFVDQLFDFAFSGEADVRQPDVLGEISDVSMDPDQLLEWLKKTDTIYVEDLNTGELAEIVQDVSFKKELTSVVLINGKLVQNGGEISFLPLNVALGVHSLDEYGQYRGDLPKFYLSFANEIEAIEYDFSMEIRSDSNGIFRMETFKDFLIGRELQFTQGEKMRFDLDFNFQERKLNCSAIKVEDEMPI